MSWITIILMKYQLNRANKQLENHDNEIVKKALRHLIESYKSAIGFLEANS